VEGKGIFPEPKVVRNPRTAKFLEPKSHPVADKETEAWKSEDTVPRLLYQSAIAV